MVLLKAGPRRGTEVTELIKNILCILCILVAIKYELEFRMQKMIRVFARKTKWTPPDKWAFYGSPPLSVLNMRKGTPVAVSCTFTWDIPRAHELAEEWSLHFNNVSVGGPAFDDPGSEFIPGRFVKKSVTITSRGCPKRCPWCLVPTREGGIRELKIQPGNIVQDNNLLACSKDHIERVFEMLAGQRKGIKFLGGLDIDYIKPWHVELLKKIKIGKCGLCVSCDRPEDLKRLDKAADLLGDFTIEKKRCYVLVGRDGETQKQAQARCRAVLAMGFLVYAMLYRGIDSGPSRGEWHDFCNFWSDPGKYRKIFNNKGTEAQRHKGTEE